MVASKINPKEIDALLDIKPMSLLQKLHAVMSEVGSLSKDKKNMAQHYEYLSESAVKYAIQPLLVKYNILFNLNVIDRTDTDIGTTSSGNKMIRTDLKLEYIFRDVEGSDTLVGTFTGSGTDVGDKGAYKAITGATKYILTTTFLIPTGDDPEKELPVMKQVVNVKNEDTGHLSTLLNDIDSREEKEAACKVEHDVLPVRTVKKEGLNLGRKFSSCPECGMFKWIS